MKFTQDELELIKILVKREIHDIEDNEKEYNMIEINSPALSSLYLQDKDLEFLSTAEKYHQFLLKLKDKLEKNE